MKLTKPNRRILILCEGETEYFYSKALQQKLPRNIQRSVSIEINYGSQNDPKSLAQEAKRKKEKARKDRNPYELIWIFFDNDNWPQLSDAFNIIQKEGFKMAYSSMCIEHWFILHFENCGKAFLNGEEALRYLKTLWPEYHKTKINHYQVIEERLNEAINRAKILKKNLPKEIENYRKNPFFTIDELIAFFQALANE